MRRTIALAAAAVMLTGCGMLPGQAQAGGGEEKQGEEKQAVSQSQPEPTATPEQDAPEQEAPAATAPEEVKAIVSRKMRSEGATMRVDITALKRQGRTTTLNWTLTGLEGESWFLHNRMSRSTLNYTVDAVALIDPVNGKRYRVARNGTGEDSTCVCSKVQGQHVKVDETATLYAVFGAPPPDVTKVDVELPGLGVIADVPLS